MKDEIDTIWAQIKEVKAVLKNTNKRHARTVGKAEKQNVETQTKSQPEAAENLNKATNYFKNWQTKLWQTYKKELKNIYPQSNNW